MPRGKPLLRSLVPAQPPVPAGSGGVPVYNRAMTRPLFRPALHRSLSARLLVLTFAFVLLAEVLIYVPSIARFRRVYLEERIAAAHLATLSLEAASDGLISEDLEQELLSQAGVLSVTLREPAAELMLGQLPPVEKVYDLRTAGPEAMIRNAFETLWHRGGRTIRVIGPSPARPEVLVDVSLQRAGHVERHGRLLLADPHALDRHLGGHGSARVRRPAVHDRAAVAPDHRQRDRVSQPAGGRQRRSAAVGAPRRDRPGPERAEQHAAGTAHRSRAEDPARGGGHGGQQDQSRPAQHPGQRHGGVRSAGAEPGSRGPPRHAAGCWRRWIGPPACAAPR